MDLLVDARYPGEHRRPDGRHVARDCLQGLGEHKGDTAQQVDVGHHAFERVAQRKEGDGNVLLTELQHLGPREHVRHKVRMGEHDPFRLTRRSGRVDDGGQIGRLHLPRGFPEVAPCAPLPRHPAVSTPAELLQAQHVRRMRHIPLFNHDDGLDGGQVRAQPLNLFELRLGRDDDDACTAILEDVLRLRAREGGVHRHQHGTQGEDREVGEHPFRPALGQDGDTVPAGHAEPGKAKRDIADALEDLLARHPVYGSAAAAPDGHGFLVPPHDVEREIGDGANVRLRLGCGKGRGAHAGIIASWGLPVAQLPTPNSQRPRPKAQLPRPNFQLPTSNSQLPTSSELKTARSGKLEAESGSLEAGRRKRATGNWQLAATGNWELEAGSGKREAGAAVFQPRRRW